MESSEKTKGGGIDWRSAASLIFCLAAGILTLFLLFKYALPILLPFVIALSLSLVTNPLADRISKRLGVRKKPVSAVMTVLLLLLVFSVFTAIVNRMVLEAQRLLDWLASDSARLGNSIADLFDKLTRFGNKKIPLIDGLMQVEAFRRVWEDLDGIAAEAISEAVASFTGGIPGAVVNAVSNLPSIALFLAVTVISCFYFSLDFDRIRSAIEGLLPRRLQERLPVIKSRIRGTAAKYIRAYVILLLLTFIQLFVGFSLIGVSYPMLIAFLVALVDILPVLGVGTVLIPWGFIEITVSRDLYTGVGLLLIYVIVAVVRQVTEPKIVAGSLGLHPLVTIISMYVGLRLFGLPGIVAGPMTAVAVTSLLRKNEMADGS